VKKRLLALLIGAATALLPVAAALAETSWT
jgi:hypothetical protein